MYYLCNLAQSAFPTPTADATYGPVNIACRTGWRFIQPKAPPNALDWTTLDACHTAAGWLTRKWSLSIKIGADTPLWLYSSATACPASPASSPTAEGTPGYGTLTGFPFIWNQSKMGMEYPDGSTQCVPIPWATNYQTVLRSFIVAVAQHVAAYNDSLLDHVVVTGVNAWTQENIQPHCATSGCGYPTPPAGNVTDLDNWASVIATPMCTASPGGCSAYYAKLGPAYDTIVNDWATAFKPPLFSSPVPLAAMFSDGPNFPFDASASNAAGPQLLNQFVTDVGGSRAIVMNNAAQVVAGPLPSASLDPVVLCYQGIGTPCHTPTPAATASIAFQEYQGVDVPPAGCSNLTALLSGASAANSMFMEVYQSDITNCF